MSLQYINKIFVLIFSIVLTCKRSTKYEFTIYQQNICINLFNKIFLLIYSINLLYTLNNSSTLPTTLK